MYAQNKSAVDQAVEGGKLLVDLIKVFSTGKPDTVSHTCDRTYADFCVLNKRDSSLTVAITHRASNEIRELVIMPGGRECSLQLPEGVWTYELKIRGSVASLRKGDLLIAGCQDLEMSVK